MSQISIKNPEVAKLLGRVAALTGEGKTEAVRSALELYERKILGQSDVLAQIEWIRTNVHPFVSAEHLGEAPSKEEVEQELELT